MNTIEARLAFVEGRVVEQARTMDGIQDAIVNLERRMDQRFGLLDGKVSRYFTWLVGLHVTTLVAVVGALLARP